MHQDIVATLPQGVTLLGYSPRCAIQGMYATRRFISVQGHPEFTEWMETIIIQTRAETGVFNEGQAQEGLGRVGHEHDGLAIGTTFLKFLLEE